MYYSNPITEDGILEEINRICGSVAAAYTSRAKAARINDALSRYFHLAFQADGRWNFDDINESSPPIDNQNIVSGTNRYKFSSFTETLLGVMRIEVLDSAGKGRFLTPEIFGKLDEVVYPANTSGRLNYVGADTFQELYVNAPSGVPTHYIKYGNFVYLRPKPNYSYTSGLLAYFRRPIDGIDFTFFTVTQASPGLFTTTASHGLVENDTIILGTSGSLLTGLSVDTTYFIIAAGLTLDDFEVSATRGGSAINTTGTQTGTHMFAKTNGTPGIPKIHHSYLARHAALPFLIEKKQQHAAAIAQQVQQNELAIMDFFAKRDGDTVKRLIPKVENCR